MLNINDKKSGLLGLFGEPKVTIQLTSSAQRKSLEAVATPDRVDEHFDIQSWSFVLVGMKERDNVLAVLSSYIQEAMR